MERRMNFAWKTLSDIERLRCLSIWVDGKSSTTAVAAFFSTDTDTIGSFLSLNASHLVDTWLAAPHRTVDRKVPAAHADKYPPFGWKYR